MSHLLKTHQSDLASRATACILQLLFSRTIDLPVPSLNTLLILRVTRFSPPLSFFPLLLPHPQPQHHPLHRNRRQRRGLPTDCLPGRPCNIAQSVTITDDNHPLRHPHSSKGKSTIVQTTYAGQKPRPTHHHVHIEGPSVQYNATEKWSRGGTPTRAHVTLEFQEGILRKCEQYSDKELLRIVKLVVDFLSGYR
jgi:hypothetical protein